MLTQVNLTVISFEDQVLLARLFSSMVRIILKPMILYLIRHGKTDAHLENRRQSPTTPLGELGKKQAEALAEKMNLSKIDHLYSSDWPRAIQTAEALSARSGLPIEIHPFVHEMQKSPMLDDIFDDSETNRQYQAGIKEHALNFDWKFNNEGESLNETIARAAKVIDFLVSEHNNDTVAIVTHGTFTAVLVSLMILGADFDKEAFKRLFMSLAIHNTGVSSFEYNPKTKYWKLLCFNDHGHLEDEL